MTGRSRPQKRRYLAVAACLAVYAGAVTFIGSPLVAQTREMIVTPDEQLVDGQYVDVRLAGFEPGQDVRVRLCAADAAVVADCAKDANEFNAPGRSRVSRIGPNGEGSTPFVIRALDVEAIDGDKFQCDAESPCKLIAFALDAGREISFTESVSTPLAFAISTIPCVESEPRVAGSGASSIRAAIVEWQAEVCSPPRSLNVSYATANSVNGKDAFSHGLTDADFAMSGVALTTEEQQTLTSRNVQAMHVPVALGSLVLAYNLWFDKDGDGSPEQVTDLRLSPETAAAIMRGNISSWNEAAITQDNQANYPNGFPAKAVRPVARADNSAATWWLTSWFCALAPNEWEAGGSEEFKCPAKTIFPAGNGVALFTGTDKVALQIREFAGEQGVGGVPDAGLIGFVYYSEALKLGLPVVALRNAAGEYVKPTTESVTAAADAGTIAADGIFTPNFHSGGPGAYPIPVVTYAIVPAADTTLDDPKEQLLKSFLEYSVGDGQAKAELRGYAPLPEGMKATSQAMIPKVYKAAVPSPSPTIAPTPVPSSAPTFTAAPLAGQTTPAPTTAPQATGSTQAAGTGTTGDASSSPAPGGPAAPVIRSVSGLIKLVSGGSAPITASELILFGAIFAVVGRALWLLLDRRRLTRIAKHSDGGAEAR